MKILKKLISLSSVSGDEIKIQKFIYKYSKSCGLNVVWVGNNLGIFIKGENARKCLIFNSHVDTVSTGNLKLWEKEPFAGEIINGKIYGLGSSDEKATVAALLILGTYFRKRRPGCDMWLSFVIGEEVDGKGTEEFLNWFIKYHSKKYEKVSGILGEPTNSDKIEIGHRGNIFIKITIFGKSGHGSNPVSSGEHAVFKMYKIIRLLEVLSGKITDNYRDKVLGSPTLGICTSISAGNPKSPNKFPDCCEITCDLRTIPSAHLEIFELIKDEVRKKEKGVKVEMLFKPGLYGRTDKNEEIVKVFQEVTGSALSASASSNDMCFFTKKNIPAVVFGPGNPDVIHKPNEFCQLEKISKCIAVYKKVIIKFGKNA